MTPPIRSNVFPGSIRKWVVLPAVHLSDTQLGAYRAMLLLSAVLLQACVSTGAPATPNQAVRDAEIDPQRAFLSLAEIEPRPAVPKRTEDVPTLSARGQRQERQARSLMEQQRYTEATLALERGLRYDTDHPALHRALAELHIRAGNNSRAERHAQQVLNADPTDVTARIILGTTFANEKRHADAIRELRMARLGMPADADSLLRASCLFQLADALQQEGYLTAALESYVEFEKALQESSSEESSLVGMPIAGLTASMDRRAAILERLGRYADAAELVASLRTDRQPGEADPRIREARLWLKAGMIERSLSAATLADRAESGTFDLFLKLHQRAENKKTVVEAVLARWNKHRDDHQETRETARFLAQIGRHAQATDVLTKFLAAHPDADDVRLAQIDIHLRAGDLQNAVGHVIRGIVGNPSRADDFARRIIRPDDPRRNYSSEQIAGAIAAAVPQRPDDNCAISYIQGVWAAAHGDSKAAEKRWRVSLTDNPTFAPAIESLAALMIDQYRYHQAIEILQAARQEGADASAGSERLFGRAYERLDEWDNAERHFRAAIIKDRRDDDSMYDLALVLLQKGDVNRAKIQLQTLLEQFPEHIAAREELIELYSAENRREAVIEELQAMRRTAETAIARARAEAKLEALRHSEPEAFRQALYEVLEEHEPDAATWLAIAGAYGPGQSKLALHAYQRAMDLDPHNERAILGSIQAAEDLLEWESAAEALQDLLPRRPNRHSWRLYLVRLYGLMQDYDEALGTVQAEMARDGLSDEVRGRYRRQLLGVLRSMGRGDEVVAHLEAWAKEDPDNKDALWGLFEELMDQEKHDAALTICKEQYDKDPYSDTVRLNLVRALLAVENSMRAMQIALGAIIDDPGRLDVLGWLLMVLNDTERVDDAVDLIRNRLHIAHTREPLQDYWVAMLAQAERYDESVKQTEQLIDEIVEILERLSNPDARAADTEPAPERVIYMPDEPYRPAALQQRLAWLHRRVIQTLIFAKRYQDAESRIELVLSQFGDAFRFEFLKLLSFIHQVRGHDDEAASVLERAYLMRPDDVGLNNDLAYTWIDRGVRLDEAERMIRFALSRSPTQPAYLDTYGWLLYKKGEFSGARKWLLRAVGAGQSNGLAEGDPVIFDHLGDAAWRLQERDVAISHWNAALAAIEKAQNADPERERSRDELRVQRETSLKVEAAQSNEAAQVAPTATEKSNSVD